MRNEETDESIINVKMRIIAVVRFVEQWAIEKIKDGNKVVEEFPFVNSICHETDPCELKGITIVSRVTTSLNVQESQNQAALR